jgi:hypothetical protein
MEYVFRKFNILNNFLSGKEFQSDPQRLHSAVSHLAVFTEESFSGKGEKIHIFMSVV